MPNYPHYLEEDCNEKNEILTLDTVKDSLESACDAKMMQTGINLTFNGADFMKHHYHDASFLKSTFYGTSDFSPMSFCTPKPPDCRERINDLISQCGPSNTSFTMDEATKLLQSACTDEQLTFGKKNISITDFDNQEVTTCEQDPCVEVAFDEPCFHQLVVQGSKEHPHLCKKVEDFDYDDYCGGTEDT